MPKKILVTDDEPHIVRLLEVNFQLAEYDVITAFSGHEALEKAAREHPDLITLDLAMPVMDGHEVLSQLRANPKTAQIPVVVISIYEDESASYKHPATARFVKPINPRDLLQSVNDILNRQALA